MTIVHLYYDSFMKATVQARLDRQSQAALDRLVKRLGWSPSKVVREGVQMVAACYGNLSQRRFVGVGRFVSGFSDLGSNKERLEGFGR